MKKGWAIFRIILFFACLAGPTLAWVILGWNGSLEKLDFDTGENRNKHQFDSKIQLSNITAEIEAHYNDRVPFRAVLLQAEKEVNAAIELPYNKGIEPALIAMANASLERQKKAEEKTQEQTAATETKEPEKLAKETRATSKAESPKEETKKDTSAESKTTQTSKEESQTTEKTTEKTTEEAKPEEGRTGDTLTEGFFPYKELEGNVIQGRGDWLFLSDTMEDFTGSNMPSEEDMAAYAAVMTQVRDLAAEQGKEMVFLTYPNKNTVYGEYMPSVEAAPKHRVEVIEEYLREYTDLNYQFVCDDIVRQKNTHQMYFFQDTHWTAWGVVTGINALYERIGKEKIDYENLTYTTENRGRGDLAWLSNIVDPLNEEHIQFDYKTEIRDQVSWDIVNDETHDRCTAYSPAEDQRSLVIIGDSFAGNLTERRFMEYLPQDFAQVTFIHMNLISDDAIEYIRNADILVLESVERNFEVANIIAASKLADILQG